MTYRHTCRACGLVLVDEPDNGRCPCGALAPPPGMTGDLERYRVREREPARVAIADLRAEADRERADAYRNARRTPRNDLRALVYSFPALARTDPDVFRDGFDAGAFLGVWNPDTDWSGDHHGLGLRCYGGRFDLHHALSNWDPGNRAAFLRWAEDPWWP